MCKVVLRMGVSADFQRDNLESVAFEVDSERRQGKFVPMKPQAGPIKVEGTRAG